ncbi:Ribosomal L11 methyltransferase [Macleaya cordata]|uniref:Ribosomal L11 methyltransferase n=1 Tax=Macleaya cordata TaxID=56857 RepID=A0A200Q321_MACCD|nr:Ribosomal L11 methyltransferase [Macleaya cordata]
MNVRREMLLAGFSLVVRSTISTSSPFFKLPNLPSLSSAHLRRPISFSSISSTPPSSNPQIPLFLRQPTYSATLSDLKKWQNWAKTLAFSVGSKFSDVDNGPDANILCRELQWLLEDAVEDQSSTWVSTENEKVVNLRTDLEELYLTWKQRIEERRPFQYIVGCEHWRDLILCVQEGVLIPRPETELIVDLVEKVVLQDNGFGEGLWADLGTGSGALAIAIGRILGDGGRVIATDLSPFAASVAEFNVQRYDLQVSAC